MLAFLLVVKVRRKVKLVCGIGVNDADYPVKHVMAGVKVVCKFYLKWQSMLERCYSSKYQKIFPAYNDCSVCEEWLTFSNFKAWMERQDWHGKELDKDLLVEGSRVYSPETCLFVDSKVNLFLTDSRKSRGLYPLGVSWSKHANKFRARCSNPFTGKDVHLGYFDCKIKAHNEWKLAKYNFACALSEVINDDRVSAALILKYKI